MIFEEMNSCVEGQKKDSYDTDNNSLMSQEEQMRRLSDKLTMEEVLLDCIGSLSMEDDYDKAFDRFLEKLGKYYRADRAYIYKMDFDSKLAHNAYEWCAPHVRDRKKKLKNLPVDVLSKWIEKFERDGEFYISSLTEEMVGNGELREILERQGTESLMLAPLYIDKEMAGFLALDDPSINTDRLTLLQATTSFVAEEMKKYELIQELEYVCHTDLLTRIPNRNQYREDLHYYEMNPPESIGVIYIDINGLKLLNDSFGHKYGDRILVTVADILKQLGRNHVYRVGGDEFVVLLEGIAKTQFNSVFLSLKKELDANPDCDVSMGSVWAEGEPDVISQITKADEQMYAEKQSYYKNMLRGGQTVRAGASGEVVRELDTDRFVVFYQPQVDIKTGRVIGAEALIRKLGENDEIISPDNFIPYCEMEGVIRHLDLFVFRTVCRHMELWQKNNMDLKIAVNFSRVTLMESDIVDTILRICRRYHIAPEHIAIEVTESISKMSVDHLNQLFDDLRGHGFTFALDDFGSKYSNLSILNHMDFDTVKLDKTLVDQLVDNRKSRSIMKNIIRMCDEIQVKHVLAEGIETKEQMELLRDYACEYGQGYFYSRPIPVEEFERFVERN